VATSSQYQGMRRNFTNLGQSLHSTYLKLKDAGLIKPLEPRPPPNPLPAGYKPNEFCDFHQMLGHVINNCFRLRHTIQDLIDEGKITPPAAQSVRNPLPNTHRVPPPANIHFIRFDDAESSEQILAIGNSMEPFVLCPDPEWSETSFYLNPEEA